ncbi:hypothetical protein [Tsukamurella paurometabola]|uniref:Uncharacterized protein n=1 Tax=Tsukamurella paurometabola TaxID=2061 RepID=A0ABS5NF12_TSUPA|nr:hypothetical protein [Tsukamurella paurometabola]MBS4102857.1 hypothetical protein [Tsukamurella paurometabola]
MASQKTQVIEWIFLNLKFDSTTGTLLDPVVTMDDIDKGIVATGASLSRGNLANFWKDLTRHGAPGLNRTWPSTVFHHGYKGEDAIGLADRAVLRFTPVPAGQTEPFVDDLPFNSQIPVVQLQSLSMPQAMKALGRSGENWHAQVVDRLNVVASFFALCSPRNVPPRAVEEVNFLQTGIKMRGGETDAAFRLLADDGQWLVSAEVKGKSEQFHLSQIARAAHALESMVSAAKSSKLGAIQGVIPLGIKVVGESKLWVVEFDPISSPQAALSKAAEGVFELVPHVPGIN